MEEVLQIQHFKPHVGKIFRFNGTRYALSLDRIVSNRRRVPKGMKRKPFILIFRGPKEPEHLPEGMYDCEVEDGPSYRMYVMPIFTPQPDRQEYQVVFN